MVVGCKWRGPWPSSFLFYHMLVALVLATEFLGLVEGAINDSMMMKLIPKKANLAV